MDTPPSPDNQAYAGAQDLTAATSELNALTFVVQQILGRVNTATLVRVMACTNNGALSPVGTVDVQPLVNQIDGAGQATFGPNGTIYGLPYMRVQGGADALVLDPKPGDLGVAVFANRDISTVKTTKDTANPGSRRRFDLADGLYLGGMLNGVPTQYVRFSEAGVEVVSPSVVTVRAPSLVLDGALQVTGAAQFDGTLHTTGAVTGDSTAIYTGQVTGAGIPLSTHKHTGVTTGGGTSLGPIP